MGVIFMKCPNCGADVNLQNDPNYKPISMWGYFGYEILFSIPIVGLILLIVFSVGGTSNVNLKNFARSYFCFLILMVILAVIFGGIIGGMGSSLYY